MTISLEVEILRETVEKQRDHAHQSRKLLGMPCGFSTSANPTRAEIPQALPSALSKRLCRRVSPSALEHVAGHDSARANKKDSRDHTGSVSHRIVEGHPALGPGLLALCDGLIRNRMTDSWSLWRVDDGGSQKIEAGNADEFMNIPCEKK